MASEAAVQFDLEALGRWTPERVRPVTEEAILAYARATNDEPATALAGRVAPPVFAVVPAWEALQEAARAVAPEEARRRVVHGEQDIHLAAPIEAGMTVRARAAPVGVHVKESGTTVVIRIETRDGDDRLLCEQYMTQFYRGITGGEGGGEAAPDHRMPQAVAASEPDRKVTCPVDDDQTFRYAEASGDRFAIHLDEELARRAGLPGIIVHGLCTMAFAGRAVLESRGERDPGAMRRLAVRFSRPLRPGGSLTTRIHDLDGGALAFDAIDGDGTVVLKDGLAELGEPDR